MPILLKKSKYLLLNSKSVILIDRLREEEEEPDDNASLGSPGGHPHYVVGTVLLRVVVGQNDEVKLFVLDSKWVCFASCSWFSLL